jgi:hypothetical protein
MLERVCSIFVFGEDPAMLASARVGLQGEPQLQLGLRNDHGTGD